MKITDEYLRIKNFKFANRFKGYCSVPRNRYLLYINKQLNAHEMLLYLLLFDVVADWDSRHPEYGIFELDYDVFARQIGWSGTKLRTVTKSLLNKNYIAFLADKKFTIVGFNLRRSISSKGFDFYHELQNQIDTNKSDKSSIQTKTNGIENNKN